MLIAMRDMILLFGEIFLGGMDVGPSLPGTKNLALFFYHVFHSNVIRFMVEKVVSLYGHT